MTTMIHAVFLYILSTCLWLTVIEATDATGAHRKPQPAHGQPIFCNPNNLDLRNASSGEFVLLNDGSFRYQLPHCRLRRFRATEAAKCLRGTHLVFMGDSLSRYFYLDLAAFLAHGKWPMHFVSQWPEGRSFLSEKEYNSWSWFYQDSNRQLNRGSHAMEVCDCARNDSVGFFEFIQDMFENRHFRYIPSGNLEDTANDVRLSYIQWWGTMPMRGHQDISLKLPRNKTTVSFLKNWSKALCPKAPESFWPLSRNCSDQRPDIHEIDFPAFAEKEICANFPAPTLQPETQINRCQLFEKDILGAMGATHLMLNTGWHAGLEHVGGYRFLDKIVDAAAKHFAPTPSQSKLQLPSVIWRQSTQGSVFESHDKIALNYTETQGSEKLAFFSVGEITAMLRKIDAAWRRNDTRTLQQLIKTHPTSWPAGKHVNLSTVHPIWHDPAHFEPYVYNEINNLFLNAVCPLNLGAKAAPDAATAAAAAATAAASPTVGRGSGSGNGRSNPAAGGSSKANGDSGKKAPAPSLSAGKSRKKGSDEDEDDDEDQGKAKKPTKGKATANDNGNGNSNADKKKKKQQQQQQKKKQTNASSSSSSSKKKKKPSSKANKASKAAKSRDQ